MTPSSSTQSSSIESSSSTGHRTAFSAVGIPASQELSHVGSHRWRPAADVSLSLEDLGSLQGATLVERLRTVAGRPLDADRHLQRLQQAADQLSIQWPQYLSVDLVRECVARNYAAHAAPDFGLVILLTPGLIRSQPLGAQPTVILHTTDLHWQQLACWYQHGQPLVVARNRNVPAECWSPHMKTRSRLHYFMADQQASQSTKRFAGSLMLSTDGYVTESSVANILLVRDGQLISPPIDSVLHGLSLQRTIRLAEACSIGVCYQPISVEAAKSADCLLLTGSSGCLWVASELEEHVYHQPTCNSVYQTLHRAWVEDIGLDYSAQALEVSQRARF